MAKFIHVKHFAWINWGFQSKWEKIQLVFTVGCYSNLLYTLIPKKECSYNFLRDTSSGGPNFEKYIDHITHDCIK